MAVIANQAVAFDKSMLTAFPHLGDVLRPGLILDHGRFVSYQLINSPARFQRRYFRRPEAALRACWSRETGVSMQVTRQ